MMVATVFCHVQSSSKVTCCLQEVNRGFPFFPLLPALNPWRKHQALLLQICTGPKALSTNIALVNTAPSSRPQNDYVPIPAEHPDQVDIFAVLQVASLVDVEGQ